MTRVPLILAHEALRRLTCAVARAAEVQPLGRLSFVRGRWYVHDLDRGSVVWPEGDGYGGSRHEYADDIRRGPVFTVIVTWGRDDPNDVVVTLTRDEVTGDGADVLRRQRAEDEARWWRENGGES